MSRQIPTKLRKQSPKQQPDSIGASVHASHLEPEWKHPTTTRKVKRIFTESIDIGEENTGSKKTQNQEKGSLHTDDADQEKNHQNKKQKVSTKTTVENEETQKTDTLQTVSNQDQSDSNEENVAQASPWMITSTFKKIADGIGNFLGISSETIVSPNETSLTISSTTTNGDGNNTQATTPLIIPDSRNDEEDCDDNSITHVANGTNDVNNQQNSNSSSSNRISDAECKRIVNSLGLQYTNSFKAKGELKDCKFTIFKEKCSFQLETRAKTQDIVISNTNATIKNPHPKNLVENFREEISDFQGIWFGVDASENMDDLKQFLIKIDKNNYRIVGRDIEIFTIQEEIIDFIYEIVGKKIYMLGIQPNRILALGQMAFIFDDQNQALTFKSMLIKDLKTPLKNQNVAKIYQEINATVKDNRKIIKSFAKTK